VKKPENRKNKRMVLLCPTW